METYTPEQHIDTEPYWTEDNYDQRTGHTWYDLAIYDREGGATFTKMNEHEAITDGDPTSKGYDATPVPEFFTDILVIANRIGEEAEPMFRGLGYQLSEASLSDEDMLQAEIGTPALEPLQAVLDEVREATGFAVRIEEYHDPANPNSSLIPSARMTSGLEKDVFYIGNNPRFRAHDLITHFPALLLMTESATARLAARSRQVLEGQGPQQVTSETFGGHENQFDAIEGYLTYRSFHDALRRAQRNREDGREALARTLSYICDFPEGEQGKQEALQEAEGILERAHQLQDFFKQRAKAA